MTKPIHESALDACRKYQESALEVERLTRGIGDALAGCATRNSQKLFGQSIPGDTTHLRLAYRLAEEVGPEDAQLLDHGAVEELLAGTKTPAIWGGDLFDIKDRFSADEIEATDFRCEHCLSAHQLIQRRKRPVIVSVPLSGSCAASVSVWEVKHDP